MRRSHSFRSWQRRYERSGRASLGRRKETRDQRGGNLLLKKEAGVSTAGLSFLRPAAMPRPTRQALGWTRVEASYPPPAGKPGCIGVIGPHVLPESVDLWTTAVASTAP